MNQQSWRLGFLLLAALWVCAPPAPIVLGLSEPAWPSAQRSTNAEEKAGERSQETPGEERQLEERHREFLDRVKLLITPEEREVFLALDQGYRRDAFIRRFWRMRDPYPETARNEFFDRFESNLVATRKRFPDLGDRRAAFMLRHGPPTMTFRSQCEVLQSLDIWYYTNSDLLPHEFYAVFVRRGGRFELWSPIEGLHSILLFTAALDQRAAVEEIAARCGRGDEIVTSLALSPDWERLEEDLLPPSHSEWARSFLAASTVVPEGAAPLEATLQIDFTGRYQSRTIVQALIEVQAGTNNARTVLNLLLDGEVVRNGELFETFRYKFDLPVAAAGSEHSRADQGLYQTAADGAVPMLIERYLRPGLYRLILRVQDLHSDRYFRVSETLDVPRWQPAQTERTVAGGDSTPRSQPPDPLSGVAPGDAQDDATMDLAPSVRLQVPNEELITGRVRVSAITQGEGIARVRFDVDDRTILSKARPPYSVDLEVGRAPRMHTVRAVALSPSGDELARDEITLNAGPNRFSIRLIEPQRGHTYVDRVRASAEVEVPKLERLDRVEFYLNQERVATLYQPPFVQPIAIPRDQELSYVRAVGVLESGGAVEDLVFVNAPDLMDHVDVDLVELYTTVVDSRGRPVEDLVAGDFEVREGRELQTIRRFERVRDLPIHAGILLDTSMSMVDQLEEAEEAALHFFDLVLTPKDRACLMTFSDHHQLVVPFTNSTEVLAGGLAGLVSEGETTLYDSLIHTLFHFNGIPGKRAVILLSDGADSSSRYRFEEVLDYARRSGVAIYSIGLGIDFREVDVRAKLNRLCAETGGRCFFVERASELKSLYTKIEHELRAQYLIAYQSNAGPGDRDFREIKVKVKRPKLKARTLRGYYP